MTPPIAPPRSTWLINFAGQLHWLWWVTLLSWIFPGTQTLAQQQPADNFCTTFSLLILRENTLWHAPNVPSIFVGVPNGLLIWRLEAWQTAKHGKVFLTTTTSNLLLTSFPPLTFLTEPLYSRGQTFWYFPHLAFFLFWSWASKLVIVSHTFQFVLWFL